MIESLIEAVLQPIGEVVAYAAGYILVPTFTVGRVRAEPLSSKAKDHDWAGARRREDGVVLLSHNATMVWGLILSIALVMLAFALTRP